MIDPALDGRWSFVMPGVDGDVAMSVVNLLIRGKVGTSERIKMVILKQYLCIFFCGINPNPVMVQEHVDNLSDHPCQEIGSC